MSNISDILSFAKSQVPASYSALLEAVQEKQINEMWQLFGGDISDEERKEKFLAFYLQEIRQRNIIYDGLTETELAGKLYADIEGYSVLTQYLEDEDVEGININSWEDIRVKYHSGKDIKAEGFISPMHAKIVLNKLLQVSGIQIDEAVPMAEGSIGTDIRITAVISPVLDKQTGIAVYIRKLRHKNFTTEEYIRKGFANERLLKFIKTAIKRGISTLFIGKVNTGKTTVLKYSLSELPNTTQIITVESGAREMNLIKRNKDNKIINNVVHMLTKESDNESQNITQEKLVVKALRLNPNVISVAEMRDVEAYAAVEAATSGHVVVSTVHAGSVQAAHKRIANLSRKKYTTDYHTALTTACEAFPLGVFIHTTEDGVRRIMNVSECYVDGNDTIHYNSIWEFLVEENVVNDDGSITVKGEYVQVNNPSESLVSHMERYGLTRAELKSIFKEENVK